MVNPSGGSSPPRAPAHPSKGRVGVDVGVVGHDVAAQLLEDRLAPPDIERIRRGEGQQQVTQRRRVQDARVKNDQHPEA